MERSKSAEAEPRSVDSKPSRPRLPAPTWHLRFIQAHPLPDELHDKLERLMHPARKKRVQAMDSSALALPDNCWQQVFSHFTENKDFFGCCLVCKKWADIVRNSKTLESIGFVWDKNPTFSSTRRAELFLDWLGTRLSYQTRELELALVPESAGSMSQAFKNSLWCTIGQMAGGLRHLAIKANAGLVTDVGPWLTNFTGLEYLLLAPRGNSLAVRTSLAGLSRLQDLVLSVKQSDLEVGAALGEDHPAGPQGGLRLDFPVAHPDWLPPSLTALRLECASLAALPECLTALSGLQSLEISTRTVLANSDLILHHTAVQSLELSGCVRASFLGRLTAFACLSALTLGHLDLGPPSAQLPGNHPQLEVGLAGLRQLKSLSLSNCHLVSFPAVVRGLTSLAFLDISFNPEVTTLPPGDHLNHLQLLAADWAAVAGDPGALLSARELQELCLTDRPPSSDSVASVLRALSGLHNLTAVYFDVGQGTQLTNEVVNAIAELSRERPLLQFKSLEQCLW